MKLLPSVLLLAVILIPAPAKADFVFFDDLDGFPALPNDINSWSYTASDPNAGLIDIELTSFSASPSVLPDQTPGGITPFAGSNILHRSSSNRDTVFNVDFQTETIEEGNIWYTMWFYNTSGGFDWNVTALDVTLNGTSAAVAPTDLVSGPGPSPTDEWLKRTWRFDIPNGSALIGQLIDFQHTHVATGNYEIAIDGLEITTIPEPTQWLMCSAGLFGLLMIRRRRVTA